MLFSLKFQELHLTNNVGVAAMASALIRHKIWLPKALYDGLPWFYLISGLGGLAATFYISAGSWTMPHYLLFCAACLHLSFIVLRRRRPLKRNSADLSSDA